MIIDLVPLWAIILALAVFFYVLLDGFDLGVGMLYGLAPNRHARNLIMNSIAPIWDGNETWLILGGMGLLAAFPRAFSIIMPALYFPILIMLLGLVFRGVAFEFRYRDAEHVTFWDRGFCYGSLVATFAQGIVLGAFIQGFSVKDGQFVGSSWDCFTWFSCFTGVALVIGYVLLGAGWLILKTEGALQAASRRHGRICFIGVVLAVLIASIWTPMMNPDIAARWFLWPNMAYLAPIPIFTVMVIYYGWRALNSKKAEISPFIYAMMLFVLSYLGLVISFYPLIIPPHLTLWQAASSPDTQLFLLIGTMLLLPIILMYSAWSYWVFRGKVRADIGYH